MIDINITLLIQMVNFFIGLFIINHFIIKPLREVMAKRRAILSTLNVNANSLEEQAKAKLVGYEERIQKARQDMAHKREEIKAESSARAHEVQTKAEEEARQLRYKAQESRVQEGEKAYKELQKQTSGFAQSFVQRILS